MLKILLIDNNDSFTFNLVQRLEKCDVKVFVVPENEALNEDIASFNAIVFSPGPGLPYDFPNMMKIIEFYYKKLPMLGVCLGHQAIAEFFGAELYQLSIIKHGIKSSLNIKSTHLYSNIEKPIYVGRYHSWAVRKLPDLIIETATSEDDVIMSYKHRDYNISGIQYHPESIITTDGQKILQNWVDSIKLNQEIL